MLLPAGALAAALDELTAGALAAAGPDHWASGTTGAAHATVRALGRWGDAVRDEQVDALRRAVAGPVTLVLRGVRRTDSAVLALASSPDGSGDGLRERYARALGEHGWLEDAVLPPPGRAIWYVSLVHFASPVRAALDEWVAAHADVVVGTTVLHDVHVCEWSFDGTRMRPEAVATVPLR